MRTTCFFLLLFILMITGCSKKGTPLPHFRAVTLSGDTLDSDQLKGKITVIKIWATWCGQCLAETPELNALVAEFDQDTNVVFLAVTDDSREKIQTFLNNRPFDYQHITDSGELKKKLHKGLISYIPEHLVVDQDLNVVFDESEPKGSIADTLRQVIKSLK